MGRESINIGPLHGAGGRGLRRLMLRLPGLRGKLQSLAAKSVPVGNLLEAYEDASVALNQLRAAPGEDNCPLVKEYDSICAEIEAEIIEYCLEKRA